MSRILRLKIWERLKICYFRLSTHCENFPDQQHTVKNKLSTVLQGGNNHHCQWVISSVKKLSITQSPEASLGAVSGSDSGRVSPPRTYSYAHPADSQLWGKIQHVLRNVKFSQSWSPQAVLFRMLTGKEQTEHTGYGKNGPIWKAGEVFPGQVKSSGPEAIQRENLLDEVRTVGSGRRFLTRV